MIFKMKIVNALGTITLEEEFDALDVWDLGDTVKSLVVEAGWREIETDASESLNFDTITIERIQK